MRISDWSSDVCSSDLTQARQPCWKLDHRFGAKGVMAQVVKTRRTGWYYRVLEPGAARAGDALDLVERPYPDWPLASLFGLLIRSEEQTSELQSLMRISYAVFCLKKKNYNQQYNAQ